MSLKLHNKQIKTSEKQVSTTFLYECRNENYNPIIDLILSAAHNYPVFLYPQATEEKDEMESLRAYNLKLVANILPLNVAEHFLKNQVNKEEVSIT